MKIEQIQNELRDSVASYNDAVDANFPRAYYERKLNQSNEALLVAIGTIKEFTGGLTPTIERTYAIKQLEIIESMWNE